MYLIIWKAFREVISILEGNVVNFGSPLYYFFINYEKFVFVTITHGYTVCPLVFAVFVSIIGHHLFSVKSQFVDINAINRIYYFVIFNILTSQNLNAI